MQDLFTKIIPSLNKSLNSIYFLVIFILSRLPKQQFVGKRQLLYDKTEGYAQEAHEQ